MQNKKRNRKRGQATFSEWTTPFLRKKRGKLFFQMQKNGAWPHFPEDTIFRRELSLISLKNEREKMGPGPIFYFCPLYEPGLFTDRVCQIATLRSQRRCYLKYMSSDARHRVCGCGSSPQMPCNEADVVARSEATRQSHVFGESS